MNNHDTYMNTALETAFDRMGGTSPNPAVGAVIVKNGTVIAAGGTSEFGSFHAERVALENAGPAARGADMYVTLEPCCHQGKTPPCTEAIINAGVSRVFIPLRDPNPLVAGRGVRALENAGVEVVIMDEYAGAAADLLRPFMKSILKKRPFLVHKSAMTLDGRIATEPGDSKWISSEHSRYLVHRLRSRVDAVIVGKNTFLADDPALNVRLGDFDRSVAEFFQNTPPVLEGRDNGFLRCLLECGITEPRNPLRVVVGVPGILDLSSRIFLDDNYLFMDRKENIEKVRYRGGSGRVVPDSVNFAVMASRDHRDVALEVLDELYRRGVMFVMMEGGGRLAGSFHDAGEIDQYLYFISPKVAGNGLPVLAGAGVTRIADTVSVLDVTRFTAGEDLVYCGYRSPAVIL